MPSCALLPRRAAPRGAGWAAQRGPRVTPVGPCWRTECGELFCGEESLAAGTASNQLPGSGAGAVLGRLAAGRPAAREWWGQTPLPWVDQAAGGPGAGSLELYPRVVPCRGRPGALVRCSSLRGGGLEGWVRRGSGGHALLLSWGALAASSWPSVHSQTQASPAPQGGRGLPTSAVRLPNTNMCAKTAATRCFNSLRENHPNV